MTRDMPRNLAMVLFCLYDVVFAGIPLMVTGGDVPAYQKVPKPLAAWGIAFCLIGLIVLSGIWFPKKAHITSLISLGWWGAWTVLAYKAHTADPQHVSWGAPAHQAGIAMLHLLLRPYWRTPRTDGT